MKAYGHKRKDKLTCKYGCCGFKGLKGLNSTKLVNKAAKKRARQKAIQFIKSKFILTE